MLVAELVLEYIKALIWPLFMLFIFLRYYEVIAHLIPRSKIRITLYGIEIETTLSELEQVTFQNLGGSLSPKQMELLNRLFKEGPIYFNRGIPKDSRIWIRPVMNAGLIKTLPERAHLGETQALDLTPLGKLLMRKRTQ